MFSGVFQTLPAAGIFRQWASWMRYQFASMKCYLLH